MGFLTANSCCCFDLKTGGLIIGYIGLFFEVIAIYRALFDPISWFFLLTLIWTLSTVGWLYSVHKAKLMFMLPDLVSSMTIAFILITILILAPICYLAGVNIFAKISATDSHAAEAVSSSGMDIARDLLGALFYVVWMVFAIPTAIYWYFNTVKYSLYMSMKQSENEPTQDVVQMTTINLPN